MAPPSDGKEMQDAWRALDQASDREASGWKTIRVSAGRPCQVRAGRRFPENEEALLVGFKSMRLPKAEHLPTGRGFTVSEANLGPDGGDLRWVALCRLKAGSRELFSVMALDVADLLESCDKDQESVAFHAFLARIRAWQDFMQRGAGGVLAPEREVGLFGELHLLRTLLGAGMSPDLAVRAWQGPLGGLQDFVIGSGAIEVKSTVAVNTFPARVGSLEQLDEDLVASLYLAGIRLEVGQRGRSLPDAVADMRDLLEIDHLAKRDFESRLVHAGYLDSVAGQYSRQFEFVRSRLFHVIAPFPRLTRGVVPAGVVRAMYEIDLELCTSPEVELMTVLKELGGIA